MTDPSGTEWEVARSWFALPRWWRPRGRPELDAPPGLDALVIDDSLVGIVVGLVLGAALLVAIWLLLPLVLLVVAVVVAVALSCARLTSVATWEVTARSGSRRLTWHARGPVRSRRAMRRVAAALERGDEPEVGGRAGRLDRGNGRSTLRT